MRRTRLTSSPIRSGPARWWFLRRFLPDLRREWPGHDQIEPPSNGSIWSFLLSPLATPAPLLAPELRWTPSNRLRSGAPLHCWPCSVVSYRGCTPAAKGLLAHSLVLVFLRRCLSLPCGNAIITSQFLCV